VEGDDRAGNAGDRPRHVNNRDVRIVVASDIRRRRVVVSDHAEMVSGAARRRRPVVRRATFDAVGERNPLTDSAVLDDVVVGRTSPVAGVDVRLGGDRRRSRLPPQY